MFWRSAEGSLEALYNEYAPAAWPASHMGFRTGFKEQAALLGGDVYRKYQMCVEDYESTVMKALYNKYAPTAWPAPSPTGSLASFFPLTSLFLS